MQNTAHTASAGMRETSTASSHAAAGWMTGNSRISTVSTARLNGRCAMRESARGTREISGCVSARTCKNTHAPIRLRAAMHSGARYAGAQVLAFWHAAVTSSGRFMAYCLRGEAVLGVKRVPRKENKII